MRVTIRISKYLRRELARRKKYKDDRYEDVIWDLLEGHMELNDATKKALARTRKNGKTYTLDEVKKRLGLR